LDDEVGYYGVLGLEAGHEKGAAFFVEVLYRQLEGTVSGVQSSGSPQHDTDVDIDLSGPAANVGVVWRY
jgi:hypothetical protein